MELIIVHRLILTIVKMTFLILDEGLTYGINEILESLGKMFSINFTKAKTKFCSSLHYNADNTFSDSTADLLVC